ncbi:ABC transporter ATP-binding protein [Roseofilum casamattae]|uniref:ATP-binding cassette domain-containing protein n=1 Tax=Roseofilum casamattae BLCC-M143 TaxID=3022442 RepID=A0ABT7BSS4_9CYAN|nr:ATP-binding cassette domain-containing protein [Roseofilum casamattae]MDJ1182233.1 ATP-binding cassette domain-containing protein [Roseofilum casamattae BLCC-M143]
MGEPLIELRGVCQTFGTAKILDNLDLTIYRGEALGIIGPSGTGKSTILRIIAGLHQPDAGEIYVAGEQRKGLVGDVQDPITIGMVFQQAALFDSLTVAENVGFRLYQDGKIPPKQIRQMVEKKLELVGLSGISDRFPAQLSGGMRKRVSFARAIMDNPQDKQSHPEVLLYDEPTAGLDPIASTVVEDLIRQLKEEQSSCGTYVMVTHQDSTIRRTTERIVFMHQGKVQWDGRVEDIDTTDNLYIRQFATGSLSGPIPVIS